MGRSKGEEGGGKGRRGGGRGVRAVLNYPFYRVALSGPDDLSAAKLQFNRTCNNCAGPWAPSDTDN